jgi:hypothetical protein
MLYTLYKIFHNQINFFPWLCINKRIYKFLTCNRNSKFWTWFTLENIMKRVEKKIQNTILSLQFLNNHHSCLKIRNQSVATGIQKISNSLTNGEQIISLSILIKTWIRLNHCVNHDFYIRKIYIYINEEHIISLSILIETWIRSNHCVDHNFCMH